MRQRNFLLAFVLLATLLTVLACDSANPVAPGGTVLTVSANPTLIGLAGESSLITITGFRPDGNPLNPGTQITLSTNLGTLSQSTISVGSDGRAQTTLTGNGQPGDAMVSVTTPGSDSMAMVQIQIGESDTTRPQLTVTATPSTLSLNESSEVSVVVRNADGSTFTGPGDVRFETTLGSLSQTVVPLSTGRASTTLNVGDQVGTATVTAFFGAATPTPVDVAVENQRPTLILTINPDDIAVGEEATLTILARDDNGVPLGAGFDIQLFATLGSFPNASNGIIRTDSNGRAETVFQAGIQPGSAEITAVLGTSDPVTTSVTIRDVIGFFDLIVDPSTIDRPAQGGAGETITLTARVQNSLGQPIDNVTVNFFSSVGGTFDPSNSRLTVNGGTAVVTLTVTDQQIGAGDNSFQVTASVVGETAAGVAEAISRTVTVRP